MSRSLRLLLHFFVCFTLLVLPLSGGMAKADVREDVLNEMARKVIDGHIRPGYQRLFHESQTLEAALGPLCSPAKNKTKVEAETGTGTDTGTDTGSKALALKAVQRQFKKTVLAFGAIEHIHFGPIMEAYRRDRFFYWPDRKGRGARAFRKFLQSRDRESLSAESFSKKSIALQGLPALELLLYAKGEDGLAGTGEGHDFACAYAAAITRNLRQISFDVVEGWGPSGSLSAALIQPAPDHKRYRNRQEVISEIYQMMVSGFKMLHELNLKPVLDEIPAKAKPKRAAFWRSGLEVVFLQAKFEGLMSLVRVSGFLDLLPKGQVNLTTHINKVEGEILAGFQTLAPDGTRPGLMVVLKEKAGWSALDDIRKKISHLNAGFARQFAVAADLPLGFNASDGD